MKIIKTGTTKIGEIYIIRYINENDVNGLLNFINEISKEQTFILRQGEQLTLEEEQEFVNKQLKAINDKTAVHLVIEINNKIIAGSQLNLKRFVNSHVGHMGITILKNYRDQGLGKILLNALIDEAVKNIPGLKIIDLTVFAINKRAKHLYESVGFIEYGRLPKGIKYKDEYVDEVYMYKNVR